MIENNENNTQKKIQLKDNIIIDSEILCTDSTESQKNPSININNGSIKLEQDNSKIKKKKRVSFVDQTQSKTDIAQIIYINDRVSLNEDKKNTNKYEQFMKQNTKVSEENKKEIPNNEEIYRIKRPHKKSLFSKRKIDRTDEKCGCVIF